MKKTILAGLLICLQPFNCSYADSGWFVGGGGGLISFDDGVDVVDTGNLFVRLGYSLGDYVDIGVDYSATLFTDDINDVDHDLDITFAYVKGNIPINDNSKLYLMLGATRVKLTEAIRNSSDSFEDDGSGVGFGIQIQNNTGSYYTAEYLIYYDDNKFDNFNVDVMSSGLNFGFVKYF